MAFDSNSLKWLQFSGKAEEFPTWSTTFIAFMQTKGSYKTLIGKVAQRHVLGHMAFDSNSLKWLKFSGKAEEFPTWSTTFIAFMQTKGLYKTLIGKVAQRHVLGHMAFDSNSLKWLHFSGKAEDFPTWSTRFIAFMQTKGLYKTLIGNENVVTRPVNLPNNPTKEPSATRDD